MTPLAVALLSAVLGLIVGSFLNVCISRLPAAESIVFPPSRCPNCKARIQPYDNIPVVSYLLLRGRCRACRTPISVRYPLVEAAASLAFLAQALIFGDDLLLLGSRLVLSAILIVLFVTDLETMRLPNVVTYPGIVVGMLFSLWLPPGLRSSLIGAGLGAGLLLLVRWGWQRATSVEALGLGDVKMLALVGAFLGWKQVWFVLFIGSIGGAIVGVALAARGRRSLKSKLPFGTFLAAAAFVASLVGDRVMDWYFGFYS